MEGETGSCSRTCITCDADGTEGVSIKVEEAIDIKDEITEGLSIKEEEEAIYIKDEFSEIKTEHEVRLWVVCVKQWQLMLLRPFIATKEKFSYYT
jgi:hypothetical protein